MTDRKPPKPPMITLRAGKLSATVPVELLPTLLRLAPAARQASEGLARLRASIERDGRPYCQYVVCGLHCTHG